MIVLDSHVVLWLAFCPEKLSSAASGAIEVVESAGTAPMISAATLFEIAYAIRKGRVATAVPDSAFFARIRSRFRVVPIDSEIAQSAAQIEPFHGDPMDRLITATAILQNLPLVTSDWKIRNSSACKTIW